MAAKKKNPVAVALAKLRAKKLSPERRKQIGRQAIAARWNKNKPDAIRLGKRTLTTKELTEIVAANTLAIAENTKAIAENSRSIAELTNGLISLHTSIKALEASAEILLESANKHEAVIANLERQWQAYLMRQQQN